MESARPCFAARPEKLIIIEGNWMQKPTESGLALDFSYFNLFPSAGQAMLYIGFGNSVVC